MSERAAEESISSESSSFSSNLRERDLVGTQLVRRNDEMACLNEKLKLQNTRMGCGEVHYNSRVKDIQVLSREVERIRARESFTLLLLSLD